MLPASRRTDGRPRCSWPGRRERHCSRSHRRRAIRRSRIELINTLMLERKCRKNIQSQMVFCGGIELPYYCLNGGNRPSSGHAEETAKGSPPAAHLGSPPSICPFCQNQPRKGGSKREDCFLRRSSCHSREELDLDLMRSFLLRRWFDMFAS